MLVFSNPPSIVRHLRPLLSLPHSPVTIIAAFSEPAPSFNLLQLVSRYLEEYLPRSLAASVKQMGGNSKPCHTCRSRRLTCDSSQPQCKRCTFSGIQCLGYGRLYKWTNAVASRGKSAGKSLPAKYADAQGEKDCRVRDGKSSEKDQRVISRSKMFVGDEVQSIGCVHLLSSSPVGLGDPSFRHVDPMARYYLDYCTFR